MESSSSSSHHSIVKVILGLIAFTIFWVLAVFPSVPLLPIGRTSGSLLGGMLMVLFQVISPDEAYAAINLPILGLLFGTMVVSVYLERADMFIYIGKLLSWKSRGGKDMVCRICFISAISSAFFTNDTSCIVLTEFVLKIARKHKLPPYPLLLGLASSANIGSSVTPIGNPQNLVIAIQSKISFWSFVMGILPAMLVGLVVNVVLLLCMYWRVLSDEYKNEEEEKEEEDDFSSVDELDDIIVSHRFSPATMSHVTTPERTDKIPNSNSHSRSFMSGPLILNSSIDPNSSGLKIYSSSARFASCRTSNIALDETVANRQDKNSTHRVVVTDHIEVENNNNTSIIAVKKWWIIDEKLKLVLWKGCVYMITIGMLVGLLMGLDMSWTTITAALSLMILDFKDARPSLEKVSYSLLVFFCGMFITIDGFNKTGIPGKLWDIMEPYSNTDHPANIAVLAIVILLLSNVASNVPTVLLLGGRVAGSAALLSKTHEKKAWLILAWVSTIAGNLSLLGSAANLIVCEQARRATPKGYNLTFWSHLKFGLPSTLIITAIGLTLI